MAREVSRSATPQGQTTNPEHGFTVTPISRALQEVGQRILASSQVVEVEENVFSTCQEPIDDLGERLLRARDRQIPLVEATVFPKASDYELLQRVFGISGTPVLGVLRADGLQQHDSYFGNQLAYEQVGLVVPGTHVLSLSGNYGTEIESKLERNHYFDYDNSRGPDMYGRTRTPAYSGSLSYEYEPDSQFGGRLGMSLVLGRVLEDFDLAIMRETSVKGDVVAGNLQLTKGQ